MTSRVRLIAPGLTPGSRRAVLGVDEPLDDTAHGPAGAARSWLGTSWLHRAHALTGPQRQCRETAGLLGLAATTCDELRDWDLGSWAGRRLEDVGLEDPGGVQRWLEDPGYAGHGGESLQHLVERVGAWLEAAGRTSAWTAAVAPVAVVRAAVLAHLALPATTFWQLDVEPWTGPELTFATSGRRALRWPAHPGGDMGPAGG